MDLVLTIVFIVVMFAILTFLERVLVRAWDQIWKRDR